MDGPPGAPPSAGPGAGGAVITPADGAEALHGAPAVEGADGAIMPSDAPADTIEVSAPGDPATAPRARDSLRVEAEIRPDAVARLLRSPGLVGAEIGRATTERLLWLDHRDGGLAARGMVEERSGRGPARNVLLAPAGADGPADPPDPTVPLLPLAGWEGRRREGVLASAEGPIRLVLRWGRLRAAAAESEVARLTLEGPADALRPILDTLAADAGAIPAATSLPGLGRALARGERAVPPDGSPANPADLDAVAAGVLADAASALLRHAPNARVEAGPEAVHRMRVALRRLRAGLRSLRPQAGGPETGAAMGGAAALARLLGPARDLDVFLGGVGSDVSAATRSPDGPDPRMAALLRRGSVMRTEAYETLRSALDGVEFRRLLWTLHLAALDRPWRRAGEAAPPAMLHGAATLARSWRKVRRQGQALADGDAEALHALRLTAKRLRYGARLYGPLWPGKATRRFLARLSDLQDRLGEANDAAVARTIARSLVARDPRRAVAAGVVEGWSLAGVDAARRRAAKAWRRLRRAGPFWETPAGS